MSGEDQQRDAIDALLDLLVYAPIGLVLDAETVAPDLAKRGRQHTAAARHIGEMAVKAGKRRIDDVLSQARDTGLETARVFTGHVDGDTADRPAVDADEADAEVVEDAVVLHEAGEHDDGGPTDPATLPIEDYDTLAASQIVKRLDALSADELEHVRSYETANRGRRTILTKLARLQS